MISVSPPGAVRWIVRTLEDAGHETWAVGGAVRDLLSGRESVDWDLATRARPQEVRRAFRRTVPIGVEHGTVGVLAADGTLYEVTTFRKDVETFGRHAVVEFADRLEDDLSRRDFTINAVAWHPLREELRDPFGGVDDLEAGILRTVGDPGERFAEDHLRVLRALRFAGRFDLTVEEGTWTALAAAVERLPELSPERVREELMKVLGADPRPSRALALYGASGALDVAYPEMGALVGLPGGDSSSPDGWTWSLLVADALPSHRPLLRLVGLLLDAGVPEGGLGAPMASDAGRLHGGTGPPSSPEGDARTRGARRAAAVMSRLRFSNADADRVVLLVGLGAELPPADASGAERRRWLSRVGRERVGDVLRLAFARARVAAAAGEDGAVRAAADSARALRAELRRAPPLTVGDLALDGGDLIRMGLEPGPRFGEILEELLECVLEDPGLNAPGPLEALVREELSEDSGAPGVTGSAPAERKAPE